MHGLKATRLNSPFSFLGTFGEDKFISIIFYFTFFIFYNNCEEEKAKSSSPFCLSRKHVGKRIQSKFNFPLLILRNLIDYSSFFLVFFVPLTHFFIIFL